MPATVTVGTYDYDVNNGLGGVTYNIVDSASNVFGNLDELEIDWRQYSSSINSITLTDPGATVALSVSQALNDANNDYGVLRFIQGQYTLDIVGTASDVFGNLDNLQNSQLQISSIQLTDASTPTVTWSVGQALDYENNDQQVLRFIQGPYTLDIVDSASDVFGNLDNLQNSQLQISSIQLTDASTPTVTWSVIRALNYENNDQQVLQAIVSPYTLNIVDSASDVFGNLDKLQNAEYSGLPISSITLTDPDATVTLSVSQAPQNNDGGVLSLIVGSYTFDIADTASNVFADLDNLEEAYQNGLLISSITLTDASTPTVTLSVSQALNDADTAGDALFRIRSSYTLDIVDSASNVFANLDSLEDSGLQISSITLTDPGATVTLSVSQAPQNNDGSVLSLIVGSYTLDIADSAADITAGLNGLDGSNIASITISDNGAIGVNVAQLTSDATAIGKLANENGNYQLAVTDTAADITADLDGLDGSNIASITISDNGAIGVNVAQLTSDATAIRKLANESGNPYQLAVTDTAADITAGLSTLEAEASHIASITVSGGPVTVSAATYVADKAALDKIVGGFAISGSLPNIVSDLGKFDADPNIASIAATSGSATLSGGVAIDAPAFGLTGSATVLTLAEILSYGGHFSEGAGSTLSISTSDMLTLTGTSRLAGTVSGKGTLALTGGSATIASGAKLSVADWTVSGTDVTLDENLTYAGTFSEGAGSTLSMSKSDMLTLTGTSSLAGTASGKGTLALTGGSATIASGAKLSVADWTVSGTGVTLDENLTYAGTFSAGSGATLNLSGGNLTLTGADSFAGATINGSHVLYTEGTTTVSESGIALGSSASSSIVNTGQFEKSGIGTSAIDASFANAHNVLVSAGTLDFESAVTGKGTDTISGASTLEFDSSLAAAQTIDFSGSGGGTLDLTLPLGYHGSLISGFASPNQASPNTVDLSGDWNYLHFSENKGLTLGTLTLQNVTNHADLSLNFAGDYLPSYFNITSGTTTTITHPAGATK